MDKYLNQFVIAPVAWLWNRL